MKKKPDGSALTPVVDGSNSRRDQRLKSAIERVFRLTHGREMTAKERREFGLNTLHSEQKSANPGKNARSRAPKVQRSELL